MNTAQRNVVGIFIAIVSFALVIAVGALLARPLIANGMAPAGLNAQVATSSTIQVNPSTNVASGFGTTTNESLYQCAARAISTTGTPIMISFASLSSTTLSTTVGFFQASSTTVIYDGGTYGCGYTSYRAIGGTSTITQMETR